MSQENLNRRTEKARYAVRAAVLQKVDGGYRVPSRTRPDHHVILAKFVRRGGEAGYRVTCHYENHALGSWRCPGNQFGHICWHVLAAVIAAVGKRPVAFFEDAKEACRYRNLGGKLCTIWSGDGSGKLYAVVRENKDGKANGS